MDQRFVEGVGGVVLRGRYRLRATHPVGSARWYLAGSDEAFVNLNDRGEGPIDGFEQNRLRGAFGWRGKRWRIEAGYEWQYARRRERSGEHRHVTFVELSFQTREAPAPKAGRAP